MVFNFRFIDFRRSPEENKTKRLQRFTIRELKATTDNFSSKSCVARGGYGKIYKGQLPDGSLVAIKRLRGLMTKDKLVFYREAEIGSTVMHQNLLPLLGVSTTWNEVLLVYTFMPNGSLAKCLKELQPPLDWPTRKRIAMGIARGLAHLHDNCRILHRDVKTENILLDERLEPVITDFGLSQLLDHNRNSMQPAPTFSPGKSTSSIIRSLRQFKSKKSDGSAREPTLADELFTRYKWRRKVATLWHWKRKKPNSSKGNLLEQRSVPLCVARREPFANHTSSAHPQDWSTRSTTICGTIGYIAPESIMTGRFTDKHDVYGYGVTLLEIISGGRVFSLGWPSNGIYAFQDWVKQLLEDEELETLVDPRLQGMYIVDELKQLIMLAQMCLQYSPSERPRMSEVLHMLEGDSVAERWEQWQTERFPSQNNHIQDLCNEADTDSASYYSFSSQDEVSSFQKFESCALRINDKSNAASC